jgi:hypothetical protein
VGPLRRAHSRHRDQEIAVIASEANQSSLVELYADRRIAPLRSQGRWNGGLADRIASLRAQ